MLLSSLYNKILRIRAVTTTTADAAVRRGVIDRCSWLLLLLLLLPLLPLSSTLFFSTKCGESTMKIASSSLSMYWNVVAAIDAATINLDTLLRLRHQRDEHNTKESERETVKATGKSRARQRDADRKVVAGRASARRHSRAEHIIDQRTSCRCSDR